LDEILHNTADHIQIFAGMRNRTKETAGSTNRDIFHIKEDKLSLAAYSFIPRYPSNAFIYIFPIFRRHL
jgi:hypothetical protein